MAQRVTAAGDNLAIVLEATRAVLLNGSLEMLASLLAPDVTWFGRPGEGSCGTRDGVLATLRERRPTSPHLTHLEMLEVGRHVVVCAEGPDLPRDGRAYLVFTLNDGQITTMRGAADREGAMALAGGP